MSYKKFRSWQKFQSWTVSDNSLSHLAENAIFSNLEEVLKGLAQWIYQAIYLAKWMWRSTPRGSLNAFPSVYARHACQLLRG